MEYYINFTFYKIPSGRPICRINITQPENTLDFFYLVDNNVWTKMLSFESISLEDLKLIEK